MRSNDLRAELAALLLEAGPDQPTLCAGWTTRDLAAHLYVREHRLDTLPGIALPVFARHTDRVQRRFADTSFTELVAAFAAGPAPLSPFRIKPVGELANVAEFSIHREDVRRAQPNWHPLDIPDQDALWQRLAVLGTFAARSSPVAILAVRSDAPGQRRFGRHDQEVVMRGAPLELLMRITGRTEADVELFGTDAAMSSFSRSDLRL